MPDYTWTETRVETLKTLYREGYSASQIAAQMPCQRGEFCSRNAVIGKAHRIGLAGSVVRPPRPKRVSEPRPRHRRRKADISSQKSHRNFRSVELPAVEDEAPAPLPFVAPEWERAPWWHQADGCTFINGDEHSDAWAWCNGPICTLPDGRPSSFCAFHHRLCYQPGSAYHAHVSRHAASSVVVGATGR